MPFALTRVLALHQANVGSVDIIPGDDQHAEIYLEFTARRSDVLKSTKSWIVTFFEMSYVSR